MSNEFLQAKSQPHTMKKSLKKLTVSVDIWCSLLVGGGMGGNFGCIYQCSAKIVQPFFQKDPSLQKCRPYKDFFLFKYDLIQTPFWLIWKKTDFDRRCISASSELVPAALIAWYFVCIYIDIGQYITILNLCGKKLRSKVKRNLMYKESTM